MRGGGVPGDQVFVSAFELGGGGESITASADNDAITAPAGLVQVNAAGSISLGNDNDIAASSLALLSAGTAVTLSGQTEVSAPFDVDIQTGPGGTFTLNTPVANAVRSALSGVVIRRIASSSGPAQAAGAQRRGRPIAVLGRPCDRHRLDDRRCGRGRGLRRRARPARRPGARDREQ